MAGLPSGNVTFLFTDIEGSTRLLHELGAEAYADELSGHRKVMRAAFATYGGVEVDTQGDAFFVAFAEAVRAFDRALALRDCFFIATKCGVDDPDGAERFCVVWLIPHNFVQFGPRFYQSSMG